METHMVARLSCHSLRRMDACEGQRLLRLSLRPQHSLRHAVGQRYHPFCAQPRPLAHHQWLCSHQVIPGTARPSRLGQSQPQSPLRLPQWQRHPHPLLQRPLPDNDDHPRMPLVRPKPALQILLLPHRRPLLHLPFRRL